MATTISQTGELLAAYERTVNGYRQRTPLSASRHERARRVMPGGDTRSGTYHPPYPLSIEAGNGWKLIDADGNQYIDLLNNYTSLIHGHADPGIAAAVASQLPKGTNYGAALEAQVDLASLLSERVDSVELVRFTNSGTEATMNAVRAARAFTGRELIAKMEGGYHGSFDDFEISVHPDLDLAGADESPVGVVDTPGVVTATVESVLVLPFNSVSAAEQLFAARGREIAAVIIEPVMGGAGCIPADDEYLEALRLLTEAAGSLLIFDEVMAFRLGYGGYQDVVGVRPDLTTFAKIIGGGFPVGAFGGRADVMQRFDPSGKAPIQQSGTFNGNAITMVAGLAAMHQFSSSAVEQINALGSRLREGFREALRLSEMPAQVVGYGSMAGVHFSETPVRNYRDAVRANQELKRILHLSLLLEGVFAAPRLMFCISSPMNEAIVDDVIERFGAALQRLPSVDS